MGCLSLALSLDSQSLGAATKTRDTTIHLHSGHSVKGAASRPLRISIAAMFIRRALNRGADRPCQIVGCIYQRNVRKRLWEVP
jgi:hypothetical protein